MSSDRSNGNPNFTKSVRSWLREERHEDASRVLHNVLDELDTTPQRRSWWAAWRQHPVMNTYVRVGLAAAVILLAVFVGLQFRPGPGIGVPGPTATQSEPAASASPSTEPSVDPSTGVEPPFTCDLPVTLVAAGSDFHPLITQDIRVGTHDGYDRIVFEYDGGTPFLELDLARPPYIQDPSGLPQTVAGSPVYRITLTGATKYDTETGEQPYQGPTNFEPGYAQIVQFVEFGDFEATHNWYLGVNSGDCLRAFSLLDPSRLVIDIRH
jgi:hypothetical protein